MSPSASTIDEETYPCDPPIVPKHDYTVSGPEARSITDSSENFPHTVDQALIRKIDLRILPPLMVLYFLAFLDRINVSNAITLGLQEDLHLRGNQINVALTIFFVPYIILEIPANILLKRFKPHIWLSACMLLFGIVMTLQGIVQNYSGLLATRFFLGCAEAGIFPGSFYVISMWYKRDQSLKRFTLFFSSTTLAASFGGLLASAIAKMDGIRGLGGWRWIFILEGILTCVLAVLAFFFIADFLDDVEWLTSQEKLAIKEMLIADQGESQPDQPFTRHIFVKFLQDAKAGLGVLIYFAIIIPSYGYVFFAPTIIKTYGYGKIATQLYSVPPVAAAFVASLVIAYASDRVQIRYPFIIGSLCTAISGVGILLTVHHNTHVEYAALFLVAVGTYSAFPVIICWYVMNLRGHLQRSIGTAWMIGFGNIGSIVSTFAFTTSDAPFYHRGYSIMMGALCVTAAAATAYLWTIMRQNRIWARSSMGGNVRDESANSGKVLFNTL